MEWATASVLTVLGSSADGRGDVRTDSGPLDVLVLPSNRASELWVLDAPTGRMLLRSPDPVWLDGDVRVARSAGEPQVDRWDPVTGRFERVEMRGTPAPPPHPTAALERPAASPLAAYGGTAARRAAPSPDQIAELASAHLLGGLGGPSEDTRRVLEVRWAGDVATLEIDGRTIADRFWDGTPWLIDLDSLGVDVSSRVVLHILALHPDAAVHVPADAAARRAAAPPGALHTLDGVRVLTTTQWRAPS